MLYQDDIAPGEFILLQLHSIFFGLGTSLMYVRDQLLIVISSSGMLAMLGIGSGPLKLW
jgi:hypothetical protein